MPNDATISTTLALILVLIWGCEPTPVETEEVIRPVRYERVIRQGSERTRIFSGSTRASVETNLSFKVGGTVVERPVGLGDAVAAGELIARLDPTDFEIQVQEAEASMARSQAESRQTQADYERTLSLYENRNASRSDLDAARARAESADALVRVSRQQLEATRLQLSYTRLFAPVECTVAQTYVEANQNVSSGQAVVQVNCGVCPEVTVSVAESFIGRIHTGESVQVRLDAFPGASYPAVVKEVGVASGVSGSAFPVTVSLQERCDGIRSGMAADVIFSFPLVTAPGQVIVPHVSVGENREGRYVFVLEPDEEGRWFAQRRVVELGEVLNDGIVIVSGLEDGELVVTAGTRRIADGQQVKLLGTTD